MRFKILISLFSVICLSTIGLSQFTNISQSITNTFEFVEISKEHNVALIGGARVAKSADEGYTWTELDLGGFAMPFTLYQYTDAIIYSPIEYCLVGIDEINKKSIIIRTNDGGNSWVNVLETANNSNSYFKDICYNGNVTIVTARGRVYRSIDNGATWSYVIFLGATSYSPEVIQYNSVMGKWIINRSHLNLKSSTDEGVTWTDESGSIWGPEYIRCVKTIDDEFLITSSSNTTGKFFFVDNSMLPARDSIYLSPVETYNTKIEKAFLLPDSSLFAYSEGLFFNIDTATENVYYYDHMLLQQPGGVGGGGYASINDFDFDETYGIAVGAYGAVSRFEFGQNPTLYVHADFTVSTSSCPGDSLYAYPLFDYADSSKWYYDGILVSENNILAYETPYIFGAHEIVHEVWYNDNKHVDTSNVFFNSLIPSAVLSFGNIDTMPCFQTGTNIPVSITSGGGTTTEMEIWMNSQLINSVSPIPYSSYSFTTPVIATQDTLFVISKRPQTCGVASDTISIILYPGDDMTDDFILQNLNDTLCIGDTMIFQLGGTNLDYDYKFTFSNNYNSTITTQTQSGTGTSALNITGPIVSANNSDGYEDNIYTLKLEVKDATQNCTSEQLLIDSVVVINPRSLFFLHSDNFYNGDTVKITNARIKENRTWGLDPLNLNLTQINDTVPKIFGVNNGDYKIKLKNSAFLGCEDSLTSFFRYGDSLPPLTHTICNELQSKTTRNLIDVKYDHQGNIYQLGIININSSNGTAKPGFYFQKQDSEGNFLWLRQASPTYYISGAVIEDIDFDDIGNVYAAMWISGPHYYVYDSINYTPLTSGIQYRSYIVKFDGQTGNMIWAKDLVNFPLGDSTSTGYYDSGKIKSIAVTSDRIYFSSGTSTKIGVGCASLEGDYIEHYVIRGHTASSFITPTSMLYPNGANGGSTESNHSPKLKELASGGVIGVGYYTGVPYYDGTAIPGLQNSGLAGMFAFKYKEGTGLTDFTKLISGDGFEAFNTPNNDGIPRFDVDNDDNLIVGISRAKDNALSFSELTGVTILDSTLAMKNSTIVWKLDKDFQLKWITTINYSQIHGLSISDATGDVFISGKTNNNIGFSNGNNHSIMGGYGTFQPNYGTAFSFWDLHHRDGDLEDFYIARMDTNGIANRGYYFKSQNSNSPYLGWIKSRMVASPCGDIVCGFTSVVNNGTFEYYDQNAGINISIDSSSTYIFRDNCGTELCSWLNLAYDSIVECGITDSVFVAFGTQGFNVDSVTYSLYENGSFIATPTVDNNGQGFYINLPNSSSQYSFKINNPGTGYDSISIVNHTPVTSHFQFDSLMCYGTDGWIFAGPISSTYMWSGYTSPGHSLLFETDNYNIGLNEITVDITDSLGCSTSELLTIEVVAPIQEVFDSPYDLPCGNFLSIPFTNANYISDEWFVNGNLTSNQFSGSNLVTGLNQINVNLVDTNGCSSAYNLLINYCYNLGIGEEQDESFFIVSPNPNTGSFIVSFNEYIDEGQLYLYSSDGRLAFDEKFTGRESIKIEADFSPGVYMLRVVTGVTDQFFKVMIE